MKTTNYIIEVSSSMSNQRVYTLASLSESDIKKCMLLKKNTEFHYDVKLVKTQSLDDIKPKNCNELIEWLKQVKLYTYKYIQTKTIVKVINLPEGIRYNPLGYIEIFIGKQWGELNHQDAILENKLQQWILQTFPTATYCNSRTKFTLPKSREEYVGKAETTKNIISISPSGDEAVEVTKRVFHKEAVLV